MLVFFWADWSPGKDFVWVAAPRSVCSAWGLDPRLPLCVELRLPTAGYTFESVGRCVVQRITQEGFEDFALESQLVQILGDFCQLCRDGSWKNWSQDSVEVPETDSEENQLYYESKKKRLIVDAMNNKLWLPGVLSKLLAASSANHARVLCDL